MFVMTRVQGATSRLGLFRRRSGSFATCGRSNLPGAVRGQPHHDKRLWPCVAELASVGSWPGLSGGGVLGGCGADDRAFPEEVLWSQPTEAALRAGQHSGASRGVNVAEPEPVCAPAAGKFPERCPVPLMAERLEPDAVRA